AKGKGKGVHAEKSKGKGKRNEYKPNGQAKGKGKGKALLRPAAAPRKRRERPDFELITAGKIEEAKARAAALLPAAALRGGGRPVACLGVSLEAVEAYFAWQGLASTAGADSPGLWRCGSPRGRQL
ncbi:unnamed protein product, partial [Effrenium voratum]